MAKKKTSDPTNESRMSQLHKKHLRAAVGAVLAMLKRRIPITPKIIRRIYAAAFSVGRFPELKGKMNPRFDLTAYPRLPKAYFVKEMPPASETRLNWQSARDLIKLAVEGSELTRLLAAYIWKRGELGRVRQVLDGFKDAHKRKTISRTVTAEDQDQDDDGPAVMWQFGRHLGNRPSNPICDQHTFRAFMMLRGVQGGKSLDFNQRKYARLTQTQIENYVDWWKAVVSSKAFPQKEPDKSECKYWLDQLLFSLGKAARPPRKSKKTAPLARH
jgi:hypothetical protein